MRGVVFGGSDLIKGRLPYFTTSVHLNDGPMRGVVFGGSDLIKGRLLYFTTSSERWPNERGGLWREWPHKRETTVFYYLIWMMAQWEGWSLEGVTSYCIFKIRQHQSLYYTVLTFKLFKSLLSSWPPNSNIPK